MIVTDVDKFSRRTGIQEEDFLMLRRLPVFSSVPVEKLYQLLSSSVVRRYTPGTILFLRGDLADHFYVLFDGWVKLFRETEDGHESVIHVIAAGESFAEAAIFDQSTFPVSGAAVSDVRLLSVPGGPFLKQIQEDGEIALNIMSAMARKNRQLVNKLEQLTVKSSTERVAMFLADMCHATDGGCEILLPHDKSLIAARLGMQPETLSRSLAKLRKIGVATKSEQVTVEDVNVLRDFAMGGDGG